MKKGGKIILISGIIAIAFLTGIYVDGVYWSEHIKSEQQEDYWAKQMEQNSYDRAFSEWGDFKCTFDNKTLTLETECGGHGYTAITIFSEPRVNISLGHWDAYKTIETWTGKNIDEIWIRDAEENTLVIPSEWLVPESFFDLINISVPVWNFYAPACSWTQHIITVHGNISSNLTIIVRKEINPFGYMDTIYRFEPVIYTFEART